MKLTIIILSLLTLASCRKCVTCSQTVTTETYRYKIGQPSSHYSATSSTQLYTIQECDLTSKDIKKLESPTTTTTETPYNSYMNTVIEVTTSCDCKITD